MFRYYHDARNSAIWTFGISVDERSPREDACPGLAGQLAQEFAFVHVVLEGFAAIDEDYRDLIGELAAQLIIAIDVDVAPGEAAAALELGERFLNDLAKMAALAGINDNLPGVGHWGDSTLSGSEFLDGVGAALLTKGQAPSAVRRSKVCNWLSRLGLPCIARLDSRRRLSLRDFYLGLESRDGCTERKTTTR
jgi:hypothetical protein